jgi:replicative DNA helicase
MKTAKDFNDLPEHTPEIKDKPKPASDQLADYYSLLGNGKRDLLGIDTGFKELNKKTLGLDGLIVLGGRAGQGKTSLALQLACNACELGTPAIVYSLEMPKVAIFTKILNRLASVKYSDILLKGRQYLTGETGQDKKLLSDDEAGRLKDSKSRLEALSKNLYIRSREWGEADINFDAVEREIELIKTTHKVDKVLVVIDHLQVFYIDSGEYNDQIDKEGRLIQGFKGISEKTGATIILISQKNKAGFQNTGLQTIKGSVDIVYLADVVMLLESEQDKKDRGKAGDYDKLIEHFKDSTPQTIYLVIDKNRYNAPTAIKLEFNGQYSTFTEGQAEQYPF